MDLFVYGTLTDRERVDALLDSYAFLGSARVEGLHVATGRYPTLLPGGTATGRLLSTDEVGTLDRYEGVPTGLYVRVPLPRAGGGTVETYVGDPAALGVDGDWPGGGSLADRVRAYCAGAGVVVRPTD
ncbi:MAG: gamma-glutamylcyclotransferase [Haloferacaceae archaeon]